MRPIPEPAEMTRRNDPCPCGSGRRYKQCCGRAAAAGVGAAGDPAAPPCQEFARLAAPAPRGPGDRAARRVADTPGNVLVVEDFLTAAECGRLLEIGRAQPSEAAKITVGKRTEPGGAVERHSAHRITTAIKTMNVGEAFVPVVGLAFQHWVREAYGDEIEWFEWPDVLMYGPGGRYNLHADADLRDPETGAWRRAKDRDYSLLIYLNEDFSGGAIEFPRFDFRLQPRRGMLVAFPSDHRYVHAALPVESGTRYVIVSWGAAVGSQRVGPAPVSGVVFTDPRYREAALRGA
jgi:predicted 2-oxoglutarate/Fe(II)-dependent dioxygenase YbiX